jgi:hypothetical protein
VNVRLSVLLPGFANRIAAVDVIYCDTDAVAQPRADKLLAASDYPGIEIWDRSQVVYRSRKTDTPTPTSRRAARADQLLEHGDPVAAAT